MTLRGLIFIALRFYAVILLMQFITVLPMFVAFVQTEIRFNQGDWVQVIGPLGYLVMASLLWFMSGTLALGIAREYNPAVQFQVTLGDTLVFAFVFLGLYFILNSIASVILQLVNLMSVTVNEPQGSLMRTRAMEDFYRPGITCVAGFASIFGARKWARILARRQKAE